MNNEKVQFLSLVFFMAIGLAAISFSACEREDNLPKDEQSPFSYSKKLKLEDESGNKATLEVQSNNPSVLDLQSTDFELVVTDRDFSSVIKNSTNSVLEAEWNDSEQVKDENYVFINVIDFEFNSSVTGFSIEIAKNIIESRWNYDFEFGAIGVGGALTEYLSGFGTLETKLSKKTASSNWFWQGLSNGSLNTPGQVWAYASSVCYFQYRFGWRIKGTGSIDFRATWIIAC